MAVLSCTLSIVPLFAEPGQAEAGVMNSPLLLGDLGELGDPLVLRPCRAADRLLARVFGASLDRQLAAGRPPEKSPLLAARAQDIVRLSRRRAVARDWEHLLEAARRTRRTRSPAVPVRSAPISAA